MVQMEGLRHSTEVVAVALAMKIEDSRRAAVGMDCLMAEVAWATVQPLFSRLGPWFV